MDLEFREIKNISITEKKNIYGNQLNFGRFYLGRRYDDTIKNKEYSFLEFYVEINTEMTDVVYNFLINISLKNDLQYLYFYQLSSIEDNLSFESILLDEISKKLRREAIGYTCYKCQIELDDNIDANIIEKVVVLVEEIGDIYENM